MKRILLCCLLLIQGLLNAQLSGVRTIGGINPDFITFADAITSLNANGVGTGGVTFLFRNGNYDGGVTITASGTSLNPITFRSETNSASNVIIRSDGTNSSVLQLNGTSHVKFEHLTFEYEFTGTSLSKQVVTMQGNASNVVFDNCVLKRPSTNNQASTLSVVLQSGSSTSNLSFKSCSISGGSKGLYLNMSSANPPQGIRIEQSVFSGINRGNAIEIFNSGAVIIDKNTISVQTTGPGNEAITLNSVNGRSEISNNYIYTENNARLRVGIHLINSSSTPGNNALLFNNSIEVFNGSINAYALDINSESKYWSVIHNTLFVSGGESELSRPFRLSTENDQAVVVNNVFANFSSAATSTANQAIEIVNTSSISSISRNAYFTSAIGQGNPFRGTFGTLFNSFAAFTGATGENGSININPSPFFVNNIGWKANAPVLSGAGQFFPNITSDIDGNSRSNPSTIGAHELDVDCIGASITSQPQAAVACANSTATFTVSALGQDLTYQWQVSSNNGQTWSNASGVNYSGVNTNTLTVNTLSIMDNYLFRVIVQASCESPATSQTALLTITSQVQVFPSGPLNICEGSSVILTAASGFNAYNWSNGQTTSSITVTQAGDYFVSVISAAGCTLTSDVFTVTVQGNVPGGISITPSGNVNVCQGQSVTLTAQSGFTNYLWSHGPISSSVSISQSGTYSVSATAPSGCTVTSAAVEVNFIGAPVAGFTTNQLANSYVLTFTSSAQNANQFIWIFPNNVISNAPNPSHDFLFDGIFPVTLIVSNECGSDTITQNVTVIKTSINEIKGVTLSVFPNPSQNYFWIQGDNDGLKTLQIKIYSSTGQTVLTEQITALGSWNKMIDLQDLKSGLYFMVIYSENAKMVKPLMISK